jgi:hypothetical protein
MGYSNQDKLMKHFLNKGKQWQFTAVLFKNFHLETKAYLQPNWFDTE